MKKKYLVELDNYDIRDLNRFLSSVNICNNCNDCSGCDYQYNEIFNKEECRGQVMNDISELLMKMKENSKEITE